MTKVVCIPCLNVFWRDHRYIILRHSKAKCDICNQRGHQALVVQFKYRECIHPIGCDDTKVKFICPNETCSVDTEELPVCPLATNQLKG